VAALYVILAIAIPTLLRLAIDPLIAGRLPYVPYFPAVMLVAVFLGWRAATMTTFGSALVANTLFSKAQPAPWSDAEMLAGALLFACASALMIVLGETLRRTVVELDETARREAFLASELGHRAKNHLALIDALARQCQQSGQSTEAFYEKLLPRIQALARAQDLLTRSRFSACELRSLVKEALKPFAHHGGITVDGPEIVISPEECTPLVMAVHELATNASKYGALTVPEGRVHVRWDSAGDIGSGTTLVWLESGGPPVEPPRRRGLGSRLIARHPAFKDVGLEFLPEGVRCMITLKPTGENGRK
jgi:two-component sensor histidine kinase